MRLEMEWPPTTRTTNWKGGRKREEECRRSRGISAFLASGSYLPLQKSKVTHTTTDRNGAALPYKLVTKSCGDRRVLTDPNISKLRDPHKMAEPINHTKSTIDYQNLPNHLGFGHSALYARGP